MRNVRSEAGAVFPEVFSARGLAIGDYNNDGRPDLLVGVNGGAPVLLRNQSRQSNHWVGIRLQGLRCNRDAIGALLSWSVAGVKRSRLKTGGGSYLSSHDPREVIGLGSATGLDWLEIRWPGPSTRVDRFTKLETGKYTTLIEGSGD